MKLLQKRPVAAAVMVLAILAGIALGQAKKPDTEAALTGEFLYLIHNEGGVITQDTAGYIEAMNASLFAQTGAQIAVDVVRTTGSESTADYAERTFRELGVGSRERNNGLLLVLALENLYNGAPDGDYYLAWGSGFSSSSRRGWRISSTIPWRPISPASGMTTASGTPSAVWWIIWRGSITSASPRSRRPPAPWGIIRRFPAVINPPARRWRLGPSPADW